MDETPLYLATSNGQLEIVNELLKHGASPNTLVSRNRAPLAMAAEGNMLEIAELLLCAGANINNQNNLGYTALCRAAQYGHEGMVNMLLKAGADLKLGEYYFGIAKSTPLILAKKNNHHNIVEILKNYAKK